MRRFLVLLPAITPLIVATVSAEPKILSPSEFKTQLEIMEVFATHLESYTDDGMFKLAIEASELIYSADHMQPPPKEETAAMWCTMAAQSLRNYIDDKRKGGSGLRSARFDITDYKDQKAKCLRALKKG